MAADRDEPFEVILEPFESPAERGREPRRPEVPRQGRRPRRDGVLVVLAAVAVVAAVVVVLVRRDDGQPGDAAPATTAPATTSPAPTTAPTTAAPATTPPPPTAAPAPIGVAGAAATIPSSTSPVPALVNGRREPVLGQRTGLVLFGRAARDDIWRVDLDTGEAARFTLSAALDAGPFVSWPDAVLVGSLLLSASGATRQVAHPEMFATGAVWPGRDGLAWVWHSTGATSPSPAPLVDHDGNLRGIVSVPAGFEAVGAFDDGLVAQGGGRVIVIGRDGTVVPIGSGVVLGARGRTLVWKSCDEQVHCVVWAGPAAEPHARSVSPDVVLDERCGQCVQLDPTGRRVVTHVERGSTTVYDLLTRTEATYPVDGIAAWSPDGRYAFSGWSTRASAVDTQTGTVFALDLTGWAGAFQQVAVVGQG